MQEPIHEVIDIIDKLLYDKGFTCLFYINRLGISNVRDGEICNMYVSCANGEDPSAELLIAAGDSGIRMTPVYNGTILEVPTDPYDPMTNVGCIQYYDPDMMNTIINAAYAVLGTPTFMSRCRRLINYLYIYVSSVTTLRWNEVKGFFRR